MIPVTAVGGRGTVTAPTLRAALERAQAEHAAGLLRALGRGDAAAQPHDDLGVERSLVVGGGVAQHAVQVGRQPDFQPDDFAGLSGHAPLYATIDTAATSHYISGSVVAHLNRSI